MFQPALSSCQTVWEPLTQFRRGLHLRLAKCYCSQFFVRARVTSQSRLISLCVCVYRCATTGVVVAPSVGHKRFFLLVEEAWLLFGVFYTLLFIYNLT